MAINVDVSDAWDFNEAWRVLWVDSSVKNGSGLIFSPTSTFGMGRRRILINRERIAQLNELMIRFGNDTQHKRGVEFCCVLLLLLLLVIKSLKYYIAVMMRGFLNPF
jgi:hypothetical protein